MTNNSFSLPELDKIHEVLTNRERFVISNPSGPRAAVLIALYLQGNDYYIPLQVRTDKVEYHKGEISFPGGAQDEGDKTLEWTALRESSEEIGMRPEDVQILGRLDDYATRSGFTITPVVGYVKRPQDFKLHEEEVAELLEVPVSHLLNPSVRAPHPVFPQESPASSYKFGEHLIWGVTAAMLSQFLELLQSIAIP